MRIRKDTLATRDIDWFCCISGVYIHAATAGCMKIPDKINDYGNLQDISRQVTTMQDIVDDDEVFINRAYIESRLNMVYDNQFLVVEDVEVDNDNEKDAYSSGLSMQERVNLYASSFLYFARKGFYSFDRMNLSDPMDSKYALIACPKRYTKTHIIENMPTCNNPIFDALKNGEMDTARHKSLMDIDFIEIIK